MCSVFMMNFMYSAFIIDHSKLQCTNNARIDERDARQETIKMDFFNHNLSPKMHAENYVLVFQYR